MAPLGGWDSGSGKARPGSPPNQGLWTFEQFPQTPKRSSPLRVWERRCLRGLTRQGFQKAQAGQLQGNDDLFLFRAACSYSEPQSLLGLKVWRERGGEVSFLESS